MINHNCLFWPCIYENYLHNIDTTSDRGSRNTISSVSSGLHMSFWCVFLGKVFLNMLYIDNQTYHFQFVPVLGLGIKECACCSTAHILTLRLGNDLDWEQTRICSTNRSQNPHFCFIWMINQPGRHNPGWPTRYWTWSLAPQASFPWFP